MSAGAPADADCAPSLTAAAVGFAVSVGLYLPTLLDRRRALATLTTEAVALASGGNRRVIGVYAFLQLALPVLGFLIATMNAGLAIPAARHALRGGASAGTIAGGLLLER